MTTKINYEFHVTADNSALLAAINNLIHLHAQGTLVIEPVQPTAPAPITQQEKEAFKKAFDEVEPVEPEISEPEPVKSGAAQPTPEPLVEQEAVSGATDEPDTAIAEEALIHVGPQTASDAPADAPDISPHLGYNDVKEAARDAKKTHGEKFAMGVLEAHGVTVKKTLGRSLAAIEAIDYQSIVQAWIVGPTEAVADKPAASIFEEPTDEGTPATPEQPEQPKQEEEEARKEKEVDAEETEEEIPTIEPEAVKLALRAYAKKHGKETAKELMAKYGIPSLPMVDKADQPTLVDLFSRLL